MVAMMSTLTNVNIIDPLLGAISLRDPKHLAALGALAITVLYWTFTLLRGCRKPSLPPGVRHPPHLHSWIPLIGSAIHLRNGTIRDFILRSAAKVQAPVFTATIMGDKCLYIADSRLLPFIFRDSKQLDALTFQKRVAQNVMGHSSAEITAIFSKEHEAHKEVMSIFHKHLLKDNFLGASIRVAQQILLQEVENLIPNDSPSETADWTQKSLWSLVSNVVFRASVGPLLSMNLVSGSEQYLKQLRRFEQDMPLLFIGTPPSLVKECVDARTALIDLLDSDLVKSSESPLLRDRRKILIEGFGNREEANHDLDQFIARANFGVLLASVGNSVQAAFWTLLNLMEDRAACEACAEEVHQIASRQERGREWFTLAELDDLKVLYSAFQETLRMYQALFVTRQADQDFVLNPKETNGQKYMIEKDTLIMAFPNTMHMDPDVFESPETFQYDRFLDPKSKSKRGTPLSGHLRPFGGGTHMCPGRKFVAYETRAFLAMLLLKYEMRLVAGETRPEIDLSRQGISVGVPERDVKMEVRLRQ